MGKKGKKAYGTGLVVSSKIAQVKSIEQRILSIEGLSCECPELSTNGQGYTNGNGSYSLSVYANGAEASEVGRLYRGLKGRVARIDFSSIRYKDKKS